MMVLNFLKSTRPSLLIRRAALGNLKASFHCTHWHRFFPLKKAPPLISVFFNGLYTPFGSPVSGGQKPQARRRKPPSGAQNRYAIRLAGHQSPRQVFAGWDRQAVMEISLQLYCWKWVHGGGLQIKPTRIVPHCSIALHLSPLEWGLLFLYYFWEDYLRGSAHQRQYVPKWN